MSQNGFFSRRDLRIADVRAAALAALVEPDPRRKARLARDLLAAGSPRSASTPGPTGSVAEAKVAAEPTVDAAASPTPHAISPASFALPDLPGRPPLPQLVDPRGLQRRNVHTVEGRCIMLHAIAHIEFNAINLALDAVARFPDMPQDYYRDWLRVAAEEGYHFTLLTDHLQTLGSEYGAFPAHDGLWDMALRTREDVLARMALVPRTLEARGLDAAPPIRAKLAAVGDTVAAGILDIILRDEIGHVAIGNRWYRWLCARAGHDPLAHYAVLARQYKAPRLRPPFNLPARREAGFDEAELAALCAASDGAAVE